MLESNIHARNKMLMRILTNIQIFDAGEKFFIALVDHEEEGYLGVEAGSTRGDAAPTKRAPLSKVVVRADYAQETDEIFLVDRECENIVEICEPYQC